MPTFRHPDRRKLVLHDGDKVWGESVDGVLELSAAAAKKFRDGDDQYGFVEDAPKRKAADKSDDSGDGDGGDSGEGASKTEPAKA